MTATDSTQTTALVVRSVLCKQQTYQVPSQVDQGYEGNQAAHHGQQGHLGSITWTPAVLKRGQVNRRVVLPVGRDAPSSGLMPCSHPVAEQTPSSAPCRAQQASGRPSVGRGGELMLKCRQSVSDDLSLKRWPQGGMPPCLRRRTRRPEPLKGIQVAQSIQALSLPHAELPWFSGCSRQPSRQHGCCSPYTQCTV